MAEILKNKDLVRMTYILMTGFNYFILYTVIKSMRILHSEEKTAKGEDTISVVYN